MCSYDLTILIEATDVLYGTHNLALPVLCEEAVNVGGPKSPLALPKLAPVNLS